MIRARLDVKRLRFVRLAIHGLRNSKREIKISYISIDFFLFSLVALSRNFVERRLKVACVACN